MNKFKPGDVVVFEPKNFNPDFWNSLSEQDKIKFYGALGYGADKPVLFVYACPINDPASGQDNGHCVLINLENQKVETMRHSSDFRLATTEEF